jgi:superfamily II DNA or RNA helicase
LAFGICKNFSFGLVCTTAERYSPKLKLHKEKIGFCSGDIWRNLGIPFFDRIHQDLTGKVKPFEPYKPKKHQKKAIGNALVHFKENNRGKLIMPCGTGKSLIAYWISKMLKVKRIVIAVPSLSLLEQTLKVWARESLANNEKFRWICVCSDDSVDKGLRDQTSYMTQDLGVEVSTNVEKIAKWLRKRTPKVSVIFVTYQSGRTLSAAFKRSGRFFDFGIFDEAHKTCGLNVSLFSHLLDDKNIRIQKRMFMTATERFFIGEEDSVVSMDDNQIFGETFELCTFKKALETKPPILCDYKILTISVSEKEIKDLIDLNLMVRPSVANDSILEARMMAAVIALRHAMKTYPIKHAISFHSTVARAKAFKETNDSISKKLRRYKKLESFHISGAMSSGQRNVLLDDFKNSERSLVTNARCLTEGVDIPCIDSVLFADPRSSRVDIVQAIGRMLRLFPGKKSGYVIIPLIVDSPKLSVRIEQSYLYKDLCMTLRALAANDERIIAYFKQISEGQSTTRGVAPIFNLEFSSGKKVNLASFNKALTTKVWSKVAKLSWFPFEEAREFVRTLGLNGQKGWNDYKSGKLTVLESKPPDIPSCPNEVYENSGWAGFGDWTGTRNRRKSGFLKFEEAREFVRELKLSSFKEWMEYCSGKRNDLPEKPINIPSNPNQAYSKYWVSWPDWLGHKRIATNKFKYLSYIDARKFVRKLKLKSRNEYLVWSKKSRPDNIPSNPNRTYGDEFEEKGGWPAFLGTEYISTKKRKYRDFIPARKFARSLKLNSGTAWGKYCKGEILGKKPKPDDIPMSAHIVYKGKGWISMPDWLGLKK